MTVTDSDCTVACSCCGMHRVQELPLIKSQVNRMADLEEASSWTYTVLGVLFCPVWFPFWYDTKRLSFTHIWLHQESLYCFLYEFAG